MLFHKKTQKALKIVWIVLGGLIIVSMVLLYTPIFVPSPQAPRPDTSRETPANQAPPLSEAEETDNTVGTTTPIDIRDQLSI